MIFVVSDALADSGVLVVRMPAFAGLPVHGATYVHANTRVIQLSEACLSTQHGWFVLCHLVGHVVLHGVKAVFFEWVVPDDAGDDVERQADEFAKGFSAGGRIDRDAWPCVSVYPVISMMTQF